MSRSSANPVGDETTVGGRETGLSLRINSVSAFGVVELRSFRVEFHVGCVFSDVGAMHGEQQGPELTAAHLTDRLLFRSIASLSVSAPY